MVAEHNQDEIKRVTMIHSLFTDPLPTSTPRGCTLEVNRDWGLKPQRFVAKNGLATLLKAYRVRDSHHSIEIRQLP